MRDFWVALRPYEHTPLVNIQKWSRLPAGTPLFGSLVVFENYQLEDQLRARGGQWLQRAFYLRGQTNYPCVVNWCEGHETTLEIEYDTHHFSPDTVERMLRHLETLLAGFADNSDRSLSQLPLLTEAERRQLLVEWNDTARDYPRDKCVHELFEEQVARTPEAVAVVSEDRELSYRELNAKANQLARYLQSLGVAPDDLVGLCLERSPELITGMLGILKAGGAYVPLDPQTPAQRLSLMAADAQMRFVLTQETLKDRLLHTDARLIFLDHDADLLASQSQTNLPAVAGAENLAYVMYTSGSTGVPKGVEIVHRGITRLLYGVDYARLDASLRVGQLAPVSFDASTFEIWGPLLHGGSCVLFPERVPDPADLEQRIRRYRVNTLWLTASLFHSIIDERAQALAGIDQLLTGGEVLSPDHVRRALGALGPRTRLINGYGPTESTTFACCYPHSAGCARRRSFRSDRAAHRQHAGVRAGREGETGTDWGAG